MSGRREPGARQRRTSAETAAAFLESFRKRGGKWGHDRKSKRLRTIQQRAKPPVPAWQAEVAAQRRAMEAGERSPPRVTTCSIRDAFGPVLADMLGIPPPRVRARPEALAAARVTGRINGRMTAETRAAIEATMERR